MVLCKNEESPIHEEEALKEILMGHRKPSSHAECSSAQLRLTSNSKKQSVIEYEMDDTHHFGLGSPISCDINAAVGQEVGLGVAQTVMLKRIKHHSTDSNARVDLPPHELE